MNLTNFLCLAMTAAFAVCGSSARADYWLNWRVDDSGSYSFDYAKVAVNSGSGYSSYLVSIGDFAGYDYYGADEGGKSVNAGDELGITFAGTGNPVNDYLFRVELYDADDKLLAASDSISWGTAVNPENSYGTLNLMNPAAQPWVAQNFHVVPEPTSGMLFLLGLASLALRRKRV